jgi:serine/threonine protein kinase
MIGTTLKHYEVEALLGKGGMGVVYRAADLHLHRPVALKVLAPELVADSGRRQRFLQEARAAAAVTHPAIAQIYDVDEQQGTIFIAMELVEGSTLRSLIFQGALDLPQAIDIAIQVCDGLAKAHEKGIVHRDIKSDNILVTPDGHAKILDFGLAKLLDPLGGSGAEETEDQSQLETALHTRMGVVMGTIAYMSPEQARGQPVDQTSDVFSLGIVIYEMVTGELPFSGESPLDTMHAIAFDDARPLSTVRQGLPPDLQRIIARCLRKKQEQRYALAKSLADDLRSLKRDLDSGIRRAPTLEHRLRERLDWLKRYVRLTPMVLGMGGVLLLAAALALFNNLGPEGVIALLVVGFSLYGWIRNRRKRSLRRFVAKVRKWRHVQALLIRGNRITVLVDNPDAKFYLSINKLLDQLNGKLLHGEPFEVAVQDDMPPDQLKQSLREPGVLYVRKNMLGQ